MFRPDKRYFEERGYITIYGGSYRWYWLKNSPIKTTTEGKRRLVWQEDGDRIFYSCPECGTIIQSIIGRKDGAPDTVINGRELDAMACEVCKHCGMHFWLTFEGMVPRKIAGAIKARPEKCPVCRNSTTQKRFDRERAVLTSQSFSYAFVMCNKCQRKWRISPFGKEK